MKPIYPSLDLLEQACEKAYNELPSPASPRLFRVKLGVSKHLLSTWKNTHPSYFNLIKLYEDQLLAEIEQFLLENSLTDRETKINPAGLIFTLRAYDSKRYIPELNQEQATLEPVIISNDLPVIENKGEQGNDEKD